MKYRLLIWDFDGTLVDSLEVALQVYRQLQAEHDLPPIDDPDRVRDLSLSQFLREFRFPVRRVPVLFRAFLSEFRANMAAIPVHDGIPRTLEVLQQQGIRNAVISSNSNANIQSYFQAQNLSHFFEQVIGTSRIQGKRRSIARAIRQLNLQPSEVLYVGDEVRDIEACHKVPIDIAAVEWGLNSAKALRDAGPTFQLSTPESLLKIVGAREASSATHHDSTGR